MMLRLALYLSCGATACYLWGRRIKGRADNFESITRVKDLKGLDDLLKEKAENLLVVVSGRVGSAAPLNCKLNGPIVFKEDAFDKMVADIKSNSEFYVLLAKIFGGIAVVVAITYGVDYYIRRRRRRRNWP